jgi:purine nucleoside permease
VGVASPVRGHPTVGPRQVEVLVLASVDAEAQPFIGRFKLTDKVTVPGLTAMDPAVLCNSDDVCVLTMGRGKANAAASVSEAIYSGLFDFSKTYFLVVGLAAMDPTQGTVGSVAWASHVVDFGISWEIDARSLPSGWTTGYLGIGAMNPTQKPANSFGSEVYSLDTSLSQQAVSLATSIKLADDAAAQALRAHYSAAPANKPPTILQCDTTSTDTVWGGALLGARATAWTTLMSGGTYCTSQQQDNATLTALTRGGSAGLLDSTRIAVLHAAWTFDRPYTGQSPYDALVNTSTSLQALAASNLVAASAPVVTDIVNRWTQWERGVPK